MRHLPYLAGGFMLAPLVLWAALWLFAFPGPKPGFEEPLVAALVVLSLPLAAWHFIAGLGYVANSMAGRAGEELPAWAPARWSLRALPPLTIVMGGAAAAWLVAAGEGFLDGALAFAAALAMGWIMAVARRPGRRLAAPLAMLGAGAARGFGLAGRGLLHLPVIGAMLREAGRDPHRAAPLLGLNLILACALAAFVFGFQVLVIPAMLAVPVIFFLILAITTE